MFVPFICIVFHSDSWVQGLFDRCDHSRLSEHLVYWQNQRRTPWIFKVSNDDLVRRVQRGMQGLRSHLVHARRVSARGHKKAIVKCKCILPLTEPTCRPFKIPAGRCRAWLATRLPTSGLLWRWGVSLVLSVAFKTTHTTIQDELSERVPSCFPYRASHALKLVLSCTFA